MPNSESDHAQNEEERVFEFQFKGHADVYDSYREKNDASLAKILNKERSDVINDIIDSVASTLHQYNIPVKAHIEFFDGSIEWIGVVALFMSGMNLLSSISGTVDFFDKAAKMIEFAVESSIRRSVARQGARIQEGSFRVNVIQPVVITPQIASQTPDRIQALLLEQLINWQRDQSRYIQVVIQNQNVITDGFIKSEYEKQRLRQYIIGLVVILSIIILYLLFK